MTATAAGGAIAGNPVTFTATAVAGAPASIARLAGDNQQTTVGQSVAVAPHVVVRDQFGNPVAGITVTFSVVAGSGSVTGPAPTTDSNGQAALGTWTLGTVTGLNRLTATATGSGIAGNPVTFSATAVADVPASIAASAGDNQQGPISQPLPIPATVLVRDRYGNPVSGVQVTFAVALGGGSVSGAVQTTNANGLASVGSWTLGPNPGPNTLTATAVGGGIAGNPVSFTALGRP
jgi:adhesin/invasin